MKEVILVSPKLGIGGIQRAMTNLANWLVNNGYQVTLISCKKEPLFYPLDPKVTLITPQKEHPGNQGNIIFHYIRIIFYLRRTFKSNSSQHIISFGDVFNPLTLIASIGLKKKVHISDRTSPDFKFKWYVSFLKRFTYPYSTTFIAQTTRAANWNRNKYGKKLNIKVIPNSVRDIVLNDSLEREKYILYVGRFAWEKNPETLIRSFADMTNNDSWNLVMCGDGPQHNQMKKLVETLRISERVQFLGQVKEVDYFYNISSIFVLPSILEGFPNALLEAMSAGLPCVCFNSIPYEDIGVDGKNFLVANLNEKDSLKEKIELLMADEDMRKRLGSNSLVTSKKFNIANNSKLFEDILI